MGEKYPVPSTERRTRDDYYCQRHVGSEAMASTGSSWSSEDPEGFDWFSRASVSDRIGLAIFIGTCVVEMFETGTKLPDAI